MAKKKKHLKLGTIQVQAPPSKGNFWSPEDKRRFHEVVAQLQHRQTPDGIPQGYRNDKPQYRDGYFLSAKEELELADDIAFLFPWEEGAETVTASTLEEHDGGRRLVIRLGVNGTPPPQVVDQFRDLMGIIERYAVRARGRDQAFQELLEKIVKIRSRRILQRLQGHNGGKRLQGHLAEKIAYLKTTLEYAQLSKPRRKKFKDLCLQIEALAAVYHVLDTCRPITQHSHLKSAITASYNLSTRNSNHSLPQQLQSLGFLSNDIQVNPFHQIDKISHYHTFCTRILCLARHHPKLFSKIDVKICRRPSESRPPGAKETCRVHGEVQLVLHHEHDLHQPRPRCIGSSKSLCFLCGLFLQKHGGYWVSHCHKKLYPKWTIPDSDWMNEEQALKFGNIVREMTRDIIWLRGLNSASVQHPPESRCHTPLSMALSTASKASLASVSSVATIRPTGSLSGSLTRVLGQPTSPTAGELSGSTLAAAISAESVSDIRPPLDFELGTIHEERPRSAVISPPPSSPSESSTPNSNSRPTRLLPTLASPALSSTSPPPLASQPPPFSSPRPSSPLPSPVPRSPVSILKPKLSSSSRARISLAPSLLTSLPSGLPKTHKFAFLGPDLEITIAESLFIFEFAARVAGMLTLSWIDDISPTEGIKMCRVAEMGREILRFEREERRCEFVVKVERGEYVGVVVVWDDT